MIHLTGITKSFGAAPILRGVDLRFATGAFTALLGPSGSGKTTLLRLIAGLEQPDSGRIEIGGRDATHLPPAKRQIGFVFQSYALFAHMSVFENIAFGLRIRPRRYRGTKAEIRHKVEQLLRLIQLDGLGRRLPSQLSGGQRQRVALARALAIEPQVLLLDEPFGALDRIVREDLRAALRAIHDRLGLTTIFVTHDDQEADALADRIVVLDRGSIIVDRQGHDSNTLSETQSGESHYKDPPKIALPRRPDTTPVLTFRDTFT